MSYSAYGAHRNSDRCHDMDIEATRMFPVLTTPFQHWPPRGI